MASIEKAAGIPVTREIGGVAVQFARMKRKDLAVLWDAWCHEDKRNLLETLADAGVDAQVKLERLTDLFERSRSIGYLYRQMYDARRVDAILSASIMADSPADGLDAMPENDRRYLAAEVCGLDFASFEKEVEGVLKAKQEGNPANPTGG